MEAITLSLRREPGEPPRSWRARGVGLAHAELEARGLELRSIRFRTGPESGDDQDGAGTVEVIVTGELRRAS